MRILGIDATSGGSEILIAENGVIIDRRNESPLNVLVDDDAFMRLETTVREARCDNAGLGIGGLRGEREVSQLQSHLRARTGVAVVVAENTETALIGAFGGAPGVVVSAHTGSSAMGRDLGGRAARVGGYGHILGDEGSLYWVAAEAIRAAIHSFDGTGPPAPGLELGIQAAYGLDLDAVMRLVTGDAKNLMLVARMGRVVMSIDDPVLNEILTRAAAVLVRMAEAVKHKLGDPELPIAYEGPVFQNAAVRSVFVYATNAAPAQMSPAEGSLILASLPPNRDMGWTH